MKTGFISIPYFLPPLTDTLLTLLFNFSLLTKFEENKNIKRSRNSFVGGFFRRKENKNTQNVEEKR